MPNGNNNIRSMQDLFRAVGRMEGQMETFCKTLKSHGNRINKNESAIDQQKGRSMAYGTAAAFFTTIAVLLAKVFLLRDK